MAGNLMMSDSDGAHIHPGSEMKVQPSSAKTETQEQIWIDDDDERKEHYSTESRPAKLSELLGLNELFSLQVWRASLAELVGTGVLVFALDTIVISTIEAKISAPNLVMSILIAVIVAILLLAASPVSGGHINPVITFAAALLGIISLSRAAVYILAQCVGAILGALALKAVISFDTANAFALGGCTLHVIIPGPDGPTIMGLGAVQGLWLEIFCNFIFLWASIWMVFDHKQARELRKVLIFTIIGIVVGLLVFISTVITGEKGYSGVGLNPARCFGAALVRGGHLWNGHWVFWVGPTIACVAFYLYTKLIPRQHYHVDGYKHDIYNVIKAMFP